MPKKAKIQIHKKKGGNITILVIFVLMASGIIGILTMHFVRQIMYYNGVINAYYKSYYLARAGLEISLTQITERGVWFDYSIQKGDAIIKDNFSCHDNCSVSTEIFGKSAYINQNAWTETGCNEKNMFVLKRWESLMLPLFIDNFKETNNVASSLSGLNYKKQFPNDLRFDYLNQWSQAKNYSLWLIAEWVPVLSRQYNDTDYNNNFTEFLWQDYIDAERRSLLNYFLISNSADENDDKDLRFCLHVKNSSTRNVELPLPYSHIKSIWTYQNKSIWLEALYKHDVLPSFLSHTSLDY